MNESNAWFQETTSRAKAISDAYKTTLDRLWWANLMFVVFPAVLTTGAAIFAALPKEQSFVLLNLPAASIFAGTAAVLTAVHKALKCEDYQAECLRLSQAYQGIAIDAHSAASAPDAGLDSPRTRLTRELVDLTRDAKAQVGTNFMGGAA